MNTNVRVQNRNHLTIALAAGLIGIVGWQPAMVVLGVAGLAGTHLPGVVALCGMPTTVMLPGRRAQ